MPIQITKEGTMRSLLSVGLAIVLCLFFGGPVLSADGNLPPPGGGPQKRFPRAQELNCQADPNGCQQKIQELQNRLRQVDLRVRELTDCLRGDCGLQGGGRGPMLGGPGVPMPGAPGSQMPGGPSGQMPAGPSSQMPGGPSGPVPPGPQ
jgi:hypothetical protein